MPLPLIRGRLRASSESFHFNRNQEPSTPSHETSGQSREEEEESWAPLRRNCAKALRSHTAEWGIAALIAINFVTVVVETDAKGGNVPQWVVGMDFVLLGIYFTELVLRLYVLRGRFFCSAFNVMDFVIIFADVCSEMYSLSSGEDTIVAVGPLRILRLTRLVRGVKVIIAFPQLSLLIKGMYQAMSAIFWGCILLCISLMVMGILAVHLIHPLNQKVAESGVYDGCDRCERSFETVGQSMLTFIQQIIAGDSWGLVTIPIIEEQPLSAAFFAFVFVTIALTIMNVILAVIVDSALKTSQSDLNEMVKLKGREYRKSADKFKILCEHIDEDQSGDLTFDELMGGFNGNADFRTQMEALDIKKEDMKLVFDILDADSSGSVDYHEFAEQLFKMKNDDIHTLLVFIRFYVTDIRKGVQEELHVLKSEILAKLCEKRRDPEVGLRAELGMHVLKAEILNKIDEGYHPKVDVPELSAQVARKPPSLKLEEAFGKEPCYSQCSTRADLLPSVDLAHEGSLRFCTLVESEGAAPNNRGSRQPRSLWARRRTEATEPQKHPSHPGASQLPDSAGDSICGSPAVVTLREEWPHPHGGERCYAASGRSAEAH